MSDIFREVEEEVRREHYAKLWEKYGNHVIVVVAAILLGVAAYLFWARYETGQREKAASEFIAAQRLAESGDSAQAAEHFAKLAKDAPGGYAPLSELARADALLGSGNVTDAIALYKTIAAKDNSLLGNVARIRAGWAMVELQPKSDVEALLAPLAGAANAWRPMAQEILAYADYHAGNMKKAQAEFEHIAADTDASQGTRARARAVATFIRTGGDKNFGTVPQPVAPASPPAAAPPPVPGAQRESSTQ